MQTMKLLFQTLFLSLLLIGSSYAKDVAVEQKVNINTADAATIDKVLLNIGAAKAEAIVAYRKSNGPFKSAEELAKVKGIGLKTVEKNRDRIVVGGAASARKQGVVMASKAGSTQKVAGKK